MYNKPDIDTFFNDFTMGGTIPLYVKMYDDTFGVSGYTPDQYSTNILAIDMDERGNYPDVDKYLKKIFEQNPTIIDHRRVLVVGSGNCWYESMCLAYGASVVDVLEIREINTGNDKVRYIRSTDLVYDLILNISTAEHAGLGRYGDELDPDGDIKLMQSLRRNADNNTRHILAVPCGKDAVYYNAHRVYGHKRLSKLLEGWRVCNTFNFADNMLNVEIDNYQPIFVMVKE